MSRALKVIRAGVGMTIQDMGRLGYLAFGLSRGGAADRLALVEGAALLGQDDTNAAIEMPGIGGEFEASEDTRIALTGAPMRASIDGARLAWNACHLLPKGARLSIGAAESGTYGYLHLGGGVQTPKLLGARSAHLAAGIGAPIQTGDNLPIGPDPHPNETNLRLPSDNRFEGGTIRIVPSLQTDFFAPAELTRFQATTFTRDTRGNRMGVRLLSDGEGFHTEAGLSILSEVIVPGDIQITGDGSPFVLLSECQTTGGYPRIGSVLPTDLPRVAQARPGTALRFEFVTLEDAVALDLREGERRKSLRRNVEPLVRDPRDIPDLLSYQLIGGVTAGHDPDTPQ
ncbi:biotin-dependent carboxyltransferase family protein [Rhodobacteraceae bacterium LMO-12]|nr:biotin-dependent carboxyltransferase family protein [Rhodobacteraceae bacterium LMO-JJ12]